MLVIGGHSLTRVSSPERFHGQGKLSDKELSGLLVTPDFAKSNGTPVAVYERKKISTMLRRNSDEQPHLSSLSGGIGYKLFTRIFT